QFRVEYAKALLPVIDPLTQDARDQVAANALRIAGELATTNSVPPIIRALKDQRAAVRYAACYAAGRVFDALRMPDTVSAAAVGSADVDGLLAELSALFAAENDPAVLDGCALAFSGATGIAGGKIKGYDARSQAVTIFCNAAGARARTLKGIAADAPVVPVMLRAATNVRNALISAGSAGQTLTNPALVAAGGLSGDMLALVARALKGPDKDKLDRSALEGLVRAAEAAGSLSRQLLKVSGPPASLGEAVKSGKDDQFLRDVLTIIGDGGVLTKSPFEFPRDRFAF
ncbi:MAG: HEAT repeat domain-containing protein, partial [Phycisphaerae bacterium]|nr:HEAT repeat domain-containing protein [Phycisphaerae bacterium]